MNDYKYQCEGKPCKLLGVFQYSDIIEPAVALGGHSGGVIAYPVAVVEFEDTSIQTIALYRSSSKKLEINGNLSSTQVIETGTVILDEEKIDEYVRFRNKLREK